MAGRHRRQALSVADFNLQRAVDSSRKLTVLRQVVLCSQSRRVAQIVVEAVGRANVMRASARHKEVTPMTDKISQQPVPLLDPPERFAGGEVVAAGPVPGGRVHLPSAARDRGQARWRAADVLSPRGGPQPCWNGWAARDITTLASRCHPAHGREGGWAGMTTAAHALGHGRLPGSYEELVAAR